MKLDKRSKACKPILLSKELRKTVLFGMTELAVVVAKFIIVLFLNNVKTRQHLFNIIFIPYIFYCDLNASYS